MAFLPENQSDRLRCYRNALGNWKYDDFIRFKKRALLWLRNELACDLREIRHCLYEHVKGGGTIDEQPERRPEWDDHEFHYDLRVLINGRMIYFETLLYVEDPNDPDDPYVEVVNVHDV